MNLAAFINDERQCDGNGNRENLRDFPVRVVCHFGICIKDGIGRDFRAAVFLRKPA